MQNKTILLLCGAAMMFRFAALSALAEPKEASDSLASLAQQAVSPDSQIAARAIAELRAKGPAGLDALIAANHSTVEQHRVGRPFPAVAAESDWCRLCAALDGVSAQHDDYASGLFWYTDFEQAKAAARAASKPILSLRLLGRLDEDCSCANSRFFRTTLYPNAEVSQYLRDHFILHWKSVRPIPRITVDFGDGRKIERTVTGNSIHYILDSDGCPIDALPGLYGSQVFLKELKAAESEERQLAVQKNPNHQGQLSRYHTERLALARAAFETDFACVTPPVAAQPATLTLEPPTALAAGARAFGKFRVEKPLLDSFQERDLFVKLALAPPSASAAGALSASKGAVEKPLVNSLIETDDTTWRKIAALHQAEATLDPAAINLIETKAPTPSARQAALVAVSKTRVENPLIRTIFNLQRSIAEDTVRNEYSLHATIHQWFVDRTVPTDLEQFNSKVYAELFLTPNSDPWLGLVPPNTFTGLDNNGLVCPIK